MCSSPILPGRNRRAAVRSSALICMVAAGLWLPSLTGQVSAGDPTRAVYDCGASNFVMHAVQIQSPLDEESEFVRLRGPRHVVASESSMGGSNSSGRTGKAVRPESKSATSEHFAVYQIGSPRERAATKAVVEIDGKPQRVTLKNAVAFWMPAQAIADGPATDLPETATFRLVFEIEADDDGLGEGLRLAVPCQYWHHEEHTPIANDTAFLLRKVQNPVGVEKLTIIDGFGLNELTLTGQSASVHPVELRWE